MQQNILELYSKAQTQSLEAQDLAWLESQTRDHPYFGMAHMVLARHHLSNKSTIKDRALLKSAAYARNRSLLKSYLQDVVAPPAKSASTVPLEKSKAPETVAQPAPEPDKVDARVEENPKVRDQAAVEVPEDKADAAPEVVTAPPEAPATNTTEESTTFETASQPAEQEAQPENTHPAFAEVPVNWFLNMHLKLRAGKYNGRQAKLLAEIAANPIAEFTPSQNGASEHQAPMETTIAAESKAEAPEALPADKENATEPARKTLTRKPASRTSKARSTKKEAALAEVSTTEPPPKDSPEYEIGAFSSFTFMEDGSTPEADESEIDTMMPLAEAVEFETDDSGHGPGQITFEEKDRIVEVTVSPDELQRYFKGRLPIELNFSSPESPAVEVPEPPSGKKTTEFSGPLSVEHPPVKNRQGAASRLIERFIEEEPTISRVGEIEIPSGDLSATSTEEDEEWVTETLASIYEKQGNKSRAIRIYEKLALRFPEKSDYFADLIQKLK